MPEGRIHDLKKGGVPEGVDEAVSRVGGCGGRGGVTSKTKKLDFNWCIHRRGKKYITCL